MKKIISLVLIFIIITMSMSSCFRVEQLIEDIRQDTCNHYYLSSNPYVCNNCGVYNESKCAPIYKRLEDAGQFSDDLNFTEEVEYCLNELPYGYKNVARYTYLYNWWMQKRDILAVESVHIARKLLGISDFVNYKKIQDTYLELIEKENTLAWDFKKYANNLIDDDTIGLNMLGACALGVWGDIMDPQDRFLIFMELDNNKIDFGCGLPRCENSAAWDCYISDRTIYLNVYNTKVISYRITDISRKTITVYCFEDGRYYTLEKTNEGYNKDIHYFVLNTATKKWHLPSCKYLPDTENEKRVGIADYYKGLYPGYTACQHCKPQ
jgi:hypothetical protein